MTPSQAQTTFARVDVALDRIEEALAQAALTASRSAETEARYQSLRTRAQAALNSLEQVIANAEAR